MSFLNSVHFNKKLFLWQNYTRKLNILISKKNIQKFQGIFLYNNKLYQNHQNFLIPENSREFLSEIDVV